MSKACSPTYAAATGISTSAANASRDSHDERQRVSDRHALRGLARWSVDAHSPAITRTSAIPVAAVDAADHAAGAPGNCAEISASAVSARAPRPAPDNTLNRMTERA